MRTFVGPRADYYLSRWQPVSGDSSSPRLFNYAAFFFGPVWLLYRRMYRVFWLTLAAGASIGISVDLVTRGDPTELLVGIIDFAVASFCGFFGTYFYLLHARRKIGHLAERGNIDTDSLARAGGVSWLAVLVFVTITLALALLELAFPDAAAV